MKAILFDFNGTMVFDGPYHNLAWKHFSKTIRGYAMDDEEIKQHVHGNVNEKIIEYLKPGIDAEENKRLSLEKERVYREMCMQDKENYQLVDGLVEFMDALKNKGVAMNIASASIKENIDFFVEVFHLSNWFDANKIKYDDGTYEDKKQMFLDAADAIGKDIKDCVVFEDSLTGIACAKAIGAGMIIAIASGKKKEQMMSDSRIAFVIEDFNDKKLEGLFND